MEEKTRIYLTEGIPVELTDSEPNTFVYNILPIGKFYHSKYGKVEITEKMVKEMADNFGKYPAYEVPVKLGHEQGALSPGKVIAATAIPSGLEIKFLVDSETKENIKNKKFRYMSGEFGDYCDAKTGQSIGAVFVGAALLNQPGHPYVQPLVLADIENTKNKEESGVSDDMTDEQKKQYEEMEKQLADKTANEKKLADELEKLRANEAKLIKEKREGEVKAFCDDLTKKGIPPVAVDKLKPLLLSDILTGEDKVIKLSDGTNKPFMTMIKEFCDELPTIPMVAVGEQSNTKELSDFEKQKNLGNKIAQSVNRNIVKEVK